MDSNIDRPSFLDRLYVHTDWVPRNYTEPDNSQLYQMTELEKVQAYSRADAEAFKKTQRWMAVGIFAIGGVVSNVLNPPEDIFEGITNFGGTVVTQALCYISFGKGINLIRRRAYKRLKDSGL